MGDIQRPQLEIVVSHREREVAIMAVFIDAVGETDVVLGLEDEGAVDLVAETLREAANAFKSVFGTEPSFKPSGDVPGMEDGESVLPF